MRLDETEKATVKGKFGGCQLTVSIDALKTMCASPGQLVKLTKDGEESTNNGETLEEEPGSILRAGGDGFKVQVCQNDAQDERLEARCRNGAETSKRHPKMRW